MSEFQNTLWPYCKHWCREWWGAARAGRTKDLMLSVIGSGVGVLWGFRRGWIKADHVGEILAVAVLGYGVLLVVTWLGHAVFVSARIYAKQESAIYALQGELESERAIARESLRRNMQIRQLETDLQSARETLTEAKAQIEELSWPEDRPKISFYTWGRIQPQFVPGGTSDASVLAQHGFYLANDGGAALEIELESFRITSQLIAVGGTLTRIEANDKGFVPVWIKDEVPLSKYALDIALEQAWGQRSKDASDLFKEEPLKITISVVYRDYSKRWYRSKCNLVFIFDAWYTNKIQFSAVEQEYCGTVRLRLTQL